MFPGSLQLPAGLAFVLAGVLACFSGYRLFRVILGIFGFILGALVATSVLPPTDGTAVVVTAIVGGAIGAGILVLAYYVGIAFAGAALAAVLLNVVFSQFGREPHAILVVAACIAGALAAMQLSRTVIIIATAFGGAWTLLVGVLLLAGDRLLGGVTPKGDAWIVYPLNPAPEHRWVQLAWIVVGAIGLLVQLGRSRTVKVRGKRRVRKSE